MSTQIRVLGIAPYEDMMPLMAGLAEEYPQVSLTMFTGDMEEGLEVAKSNLHGNYDVVISRGGTAKILQRNLDLPVVEIEISMYDVLCTMQLASGPVGRTALVSLADSAANANLLSRLLGYDIDVFPLDSSVDVEPTLLKLRRENYQSILCDVITNTTAQRLGMNSFLIVSGADSIRRAYEQALRLCRGQERLREENQFFRQLLQGQIGQTVVFDEEGNLYLSTLENPKPGVLELLRRELPESSAAAERRVTRTLNGTLYSIRSRHIGSYVAFFFDARKAPLSPNHVGIRFLSRLDAERDYYGSIFGYASAILHPHEKLEQIGQSAAPIMVSGEDGTGKPYIVDLLYMRSPLQNNPLIAVNCGLLNDKSWAFLLEHHGSPLADYGSTLYFTGIDALSPERSRQLLAALSETDVCRHNRVIFSCISQTGEYISAAGSLFLDKLSCLSLYLPPLRQLPDQISALVNLTLSHINADLPSLIMGVEPEALELLRRFSWPHNYTQFRRVLYELAVSAADPIITAKDVRSMLKKEQHFSSFVPQGEDTAVPLDLNRTLNEIDRDVARRVVQEFDGNQTAAAKRLGISRTTLWRLLQK